MANPDNSVEQRFLKATIGWIKYKPLLMYITKRENYEKIMEETKQKLKRSVPKINNIFKTCDFSSLVEVLEEYDKNVKKDYNEYLQAFKVWNKLKDVIKGGI